MTTLYKLTSRDHKTRAGHPQETQWGPGVTHTAPGTGDLCGPGWLHAYTDPLLAVLLNPLHAAIADPVLWRCEGEIGKDDRWLKVGCTRLTTIETMPLPAVTTETRVRFAILCAKEVCTNPAWRAWADAWLSGTDRTAEAARAAAADTWAAAASASAADAWAWASAADAWASAAAAAAASAWAASAAAAAASAWAAKPKPLDLIAIARSAVHNDQ